MVLSDLLVLAWLVRGEVVAKSIGMRRDNCYVQVSACAFGVDVGDVRLVLPLFFWFVLWIVDVVASVADVLFREG